MTENNAGRVHRLRGRRTVVAAMAMGLAATGSIVVATEAPAINPAVRPAVARPVLQIGSTGADVTAIQARLGVSQTGYFGVLTAAVTNFQRSNGLAASGKVGATTWAKLMRSVSKSASSGSRPVLQMGSTGPAVSDLQRRLPMPMVTGYFGTMTDAYVRALQKRPSCASMGSSARRPGRRSARSSSRSRRSIAPLHQRPRSRAETSHRRSWPLLLRTREFRTSPTVTRQLKASTAVATRSGFTSVRELISAVRTRLRSTRGLARSRKLRQSPAISCSSTTTRTTSLATSESMLKQRNDVARTADRASGFARPSVLEQGSVRPRALVRSTRHFGR